jgi:hypothetical protein
MLEGFEKFTKQGRSFKPKISIRKRGQIGFNNGSINKFNLDNFEFVVLYMSKIENKIAFKFTNDSDEEGAVKLVKRKNNYFVSGKSFLDFYSIAYDETISMDAIWNEAAQVAIVQMESKDEKQANAELISGSEKSTDSDQQIDANVPNRDKLVDNEFKDI